MSGLTTKREIKIIIEREIKILRERLNKIKIEIMDLINSDNICPEQIKSLWEMIELIESQTEDMRNRNTI